MTSTVCYCYTYVRTYTPACTGRRVRSIVGRGRNVMQKKGLDPEVAAARDWCKTADVDRESYESYHDGMRSLLTGPTQRTFRVNFRRMPVIMHCAPAGAHDPHCSVRHARRALTTVECDPRPVHESTCNPRVCTWGLHPLRF